MIGCALQVFSFTSDINFETDISSLSCIKMDKPDAEKFDWSSIQSNEECWQPRGDGRMVYCADFRPMPSNITLIVIKCLRFIHSAWGVRGPSAMPSNRWASRHCNKHKPHASLVRYYGNGMGSDANRACLVKSFWN